MQEPATRWNMGQLMELATGYWKSATLSAAVELGVFDALSDEPKPADRLSEELKTAPRHVTELLDALSAMELLQKTDSLYAIHPDAVPFLSRTGASCMRDALRFNMDLYPLWGRMADSIRNGQPALPPGAHLGNDPERTRRFALGMHSRALGLAPALLPALDPEGGVTLLDVAAGPGTFSRMLAEKHPALHVTQFDLAPVQAVARELTSESVAADRITFVPGDYHQDDLPTGFDRVLLCGAIHQESPESAVALFNKIRHSLKPNGRFLLVDMMLHPDRTGPLFSNLFSINMMLTSPQGRVFTAAELEALLHQAGFDLTSLHQQPYSPYWIIEARLS